MLESAEISRRKAIQAAGAALSLAGLNSRSYAGELSVDSKSDVGARPRTIIPNDVRLGPLRDLNDYFPFHPSASIEAWKQRREHVLRQILVSCGLWPMPPRPAITATVHGRVERDRYTVDRVFFESSPGLLVTGNLYRPADARGRLPTILSPHGHWTEGRFHDHGVEQIQEELASGGERFAKGGRHPLQARCVHLARMGCQVFLYDMLGFADGGSLTKAQVHDFELQRPELTSTHHWGLFSAQAELRCLNVCGLQTWNSLRALDWLCSRDDVDQTRIGMTGASGGGTQTFLLTAIDERIAASFPAAMVSTSMQGGCTCENASYLRINSGNVEFAAMAAPRPLGLTAADDWTSEMETKGFPELRQHYAMLGAADKVIGQYFKFPHNYNSVSRAMMYAFFRRHFGLAEQPEQESDYEPLTREEATVFNDAYPAPIKDEVTEIAMLRAMDNQSRQQLAKFTPVDAASWSEYRRVIGGAWQVMIGRSLPVATDLEYEQLSEEKRDSWTVFTAWLRNTTHGEELPSVFLLPHEWNQQVVVWVGGDGKREVLSSEGEVAEPIVRLLKRGYAVASADLLYLGDFVGNGVPLVEARRVEYRSAAVPFTLCYNHSLFAQRVHDILTLLAFVKHHESKPSKICLAGDGAAGIWATAAAAVAPDAVDRLAVDTKGFRFAIITSDTDVNLVPGALKYGDVPALLALCAPIRMGIAGEPTPLPPVTSMAYRVTRGHVDAIVCPANQVSHAIAEWILS